MRALCRALLVITILLTSFHALATQPVHACSCPFDLNWLPSGNYDKIFLGHVLDSKPVPIATSSRFGTICKHVVTFSAPIKWKGDVNPIEIAQTDQSSGGDCGMGQQTKGREYVVFLHSETTRLAGNYPNFSICQVGPVEKVEEVYGKGEYVGSICPQISDKVPQDVQARALRYPHEFRDWGKRDGAPFYSWYKRLSLMNSGMQYHPLYNSAVWKAGCY